MHKHSCIVSSKLLLLPCSVLFVLSTPSLLWKEDITNFYGKHCTSSICSSPSLSNIYLLLISFKRGVLFNLRLFRKGIMRQYMHFLLELLQTNKEANLGYSLLTVLIFKPHSSNEEEDIKKKRCCIMDIFSSTLLLIIHSRKIFYICKDTIWFFGVDVLISIKINFYLSKISIAMSHSCIYSNFSSFCFLWECSCII